jgi:hypothetical protein
VVEQLIRNQQVWGSNPHAGSSENKGLAVATNPIFISGFHPGYRHDLADPGFFPSIACGNAPTPAHCFGDALYFSFITGLTIEYGDVVVKTLSGRCVAIIIGLIGKLFTVFMVAATVRAAQKTYHPD